MFFFLLFSIGPKKQIIEKPSMAPIIEDVIESTGPIGMFSNASIGIIYNLLRINWFVFFYRKW